MNNISVERLEGPLADSCAVEVVERKGLGHPDTICDMLSERLSVALSRRYLERFGRILHHNVDKALLTAGQANAAFGAGEVIEPIDLYLSGRATIDYAGERVAVEELARQAIASFFHDHFHALDPDKHIRLHCLVRPGSRDLVDIMLRQRERGVLLCNDTSCGVVCCASYRTREDCPRGRASPQCARNEVRFPRLRPRRKDNGRPRSRDHNADDRLRSDLPISLWSRGLCRRQARGRRIRQRHSRIGDR